MIRVCMYIHMYVRCVDFIIGKSYKLNTTCSVDTCLLDYYSDVSLDYCVYGLQCGSVCWVQLVANCLLEEESPMVVLLGMEQWSSM